MWCKRYLSGVVDALSGSRSVVTIGAYDGIHVGHQALLSRTKRVALDHRLPAVVMSFEPTPKEYFGGANAPARITRFGERARLFEDAGIDGFFCVRFDASLAAISVDAFIREYIVEALNTRHLVVGDDFRFGARASGGVEDLIQAGQQGDFTVEQLSSITDASGLRYSSTAVREALETGDLALVRRLLDRPYVLTGRVVHGQQLGRTLGFPTANIRLKRRVAPVSGVFAVRVLIDGAWHEGVASIGTRPTVNGEGVLLEVFVFDFASDLYGRYLDVELVDQLRGEEKFDSLDEMTMQMHRDVSDAKTALARYRGDIPSR
ncbi:MAG: bifunctional riboflavin kinase/FAD synthetase [Pseudomonadota bacterium]